MKGKIIVFEGTDSSGKGTQSKLLVKRLKKEGFKAELVSFPRYNKFFGSLIKEYLKGSFGKKEDLPAEVPSMLYALDRFSAMPEIEKKLKQGTLIIFDRYTASNLAHQAAKFSSKEKQKKFIEWASELEAKLPKPDLTIFLDMPVLYSMRLMKHRKKTVDIHETDLSYLKKTRQIYLQLAKKNKWKVIESVQNKGLRSVEEIHEEIWKIVSSFLEEQKFKYN